MYLSLYILDSLPVYDDDDDDDDDGEDEFYRREVGSDCRWQPEAVRLLHGTEYCSVCEWGSAVYCSPRTFSASSRSLANM